MGKANRLIELILNKIKIYWIIIYLNYIYYSTLLFTAKLVISWQRTLDNRKKENCSQVFSGLTFALHIKLLKSYILFNSFNKTVNLIAISVFLQSFWLMSPDHFVTYIKNGGERYMPPVLKAEITTFVPSSSIKVMSKC